MLNRLFLRGSAAVELGLLLPILVLLCFGIAEYGRAMYQYDTLTKSVRDGTRFLSQYSAGPITLENGKTSIDIAQCLAAFGNRDCSGDPLLPGLTSASFSVCDASNCADHLNQPSGSGTVSLVSMSITDYPFITLLPALLPRLKDLKFGTISASMRQGP